MIAYCREKAKKWDICPDICRTFSVQMYGICTTFVMEEYDAWSTDKPVRVSRI